MKIEPHSLPTMSLDWGAIKWFVSPDATPGAGLSFGEVMLLPGKGHDRHNHPTSEEVLHVLEGSGLQMVDDGEPFPVTVGDTIYIPTAVYHSTLNTSWTPMRLIAVYNPGGEERVLEGQPDFQRLPAGELPAFDRGSSSAPPSSQVDAATGPGVSAIS